MLWAGMSIEVELGTRLKVVRDVDDVSVTFAGKKEEVGTEFAVSALGGSKTL